MMKLRSSAGIWPRVCVQVFHLWTVYFIFHALSSVLYILMLREGPLPLNRRRNNSMWIIIIKQQQQPNNRYWKSNYFVMHHDRCSTLTALQGGIYSFIPISQRMKLRLRERHDLPKVTQLEVCCLYTLMVFFSVKLQTFRRQGLSLTDFFVPRSPCGVVFQWSLPMRHLNGWVFSDP